MCDRQGRGKWFLLLACVIMVVCLVRQGLLFRTLPPSPSTSFLQTANVKGAVLSDALKPCQLSAYSLLIAQPPFFDCVLPMLGLLLTMIALLGKQACSFPPAYAFSSPILRIHLKNCVFRE